MSGPAGMYPYLVESTEETYAYPEFQPVRTSTETIPGAFPRIENELSRKRVIIHSLLFLVTAVTATMTGANWELMGQSQPTSPFGSILSIFPGLPVAVAHGDFAALTRGLTFAFTLLAILSAHEFGHYFACRYYKIRATLP